MPTSFDRLIVCLPDRSPVEALLADAARFVSRLPSPAIEVVAAPEHGLHGPRRDVVRTAFGRPPDAIHLVPAAHATVDFAVSRADRSTIIVTGECGRWRLPRRPPAPALVMSAPVEGQSVVALVDPVRDTTAAVTMAMSLAARLSAARVVVCRVFFDEAAAACDAWEQRALDAEIERLDIYLARVPIDADVAVVPRVLQSPYVDRSIARVAADERAALVVSATRLAADVPVLTLPEEVVRRPLPPSGVVGLWHAFLDGPDAVPA
jgi:hypothetical protein